MIYGYCRVSSRGQLENNSLDLQEREILNRFAGENPLKSLKPVATTGEIIGGHTLDYIYSASR